MQRCVTNNRYYVPGIIVVTLKPGFPFGGDEETLKADILRMARERLSPYEVPKYNERPCSKLQGIKTERIFPRSKLRGIIKLK